MGKLNWSRILDIALRDAAFLLALYFGAWIIAVWVRKQDSTLMQIVLANPLWFVALIASVAGFKVAQGALRD